MQLAIVTMKKCNSSCRKLFNVSGNECLYIVVTVLTLKTFPVKVVSLYTNPETAASISPLRYRKQRWATSVKGSIEKHVLITSTENRNFNKQTKWLPQVYFKKSWLGASPCMHFSATFALQSPRLECGKSYMHSKLKQENPNWCPFIFLL